jgi:hypothetical protein
VQLLLVGSMLRVKVASNRGATAVTTREASMVAGLIPRIRDARGLDGSEMLTEGVEETHRRMRLSYKTD